MAIHMSAGAGCCPNSLLLVTVHRDWSWPAQADVAHSAEAGLTLWTERRHPYVCADFGALGDHCTGPRLARTLRDRDRRVTVYLMAGVVQPAHVMWARSCGAVAVIPRSLPGIAQALPQLRLSSCEPSATERLAQFLTARLLRHGGVGPVAPVLVEDAIEDVMRNRPGEPPSLEEVCAVLLRQVMSPAGRQAFLNSLKET